MSGTQRRCDLCVSGVTCGNISGQHLGFVFCSPECQNTVLAVSAEQLWVQRGMWLFSKENLKSQKLAADQ